MELIEELRALAENEESMFRAQLHREDIARLEKLTQLAGTSESLEDFKKAGTYIGWSQNDMMTHRIAGSLSELLDAIYQQHHSERSSKNTSAVKEAWIRLCQERNEKLIKCL